MKKLSVILPIYNVEEYLEDCLNSLLPQITDEVEVICVEDCSTDNTKQILENYSKEFEMVTLYHNENSGVAVTRSDGIKMAQGEYIYCLDPDDYLLPGAIRWILDIVNSGKYDMFTFDTDPDIEEGLETTLVFSGKRGNEYEHGISGPELYIQLNNNKEYYCTVWQHVYKRSLLLDNDIFFVPGRIHEDYLFCFLTYMHAKSVAAFHDCIHRYRMRPKSITNDIKYDSRRQIDTLDTYNDVYVFGLQTQDELVKEATLIQLKNLANKVKYLNRLGIRCNHNELDCLQKYTLDILLHTT